MNGKINIKDQVSEIYYANANSAALPFVKRTWKANGEVERKIR